MKLPPDFNLFLEIDEIVLSVENINTTNMIPKIVNQTAGEWAFDKLANILSQSLWVDVEEVSAQ